MERYITTSQTIGFIITQLIASSIMRITASWVTMPIPEKETLAALFEYFRFMVSVFCVECVHNNCAIYATGYNFVLFTKCCDVTNFVRYDFSFFPFTCVCPICSSSKERQAKESL